MFNKLKSLSFFRHLIALSVPEAINAILKVFLGLITAKILGPENLGIVSAVGMVMVFGSLLQGGILDGLALKIPLLIGKNKKTEAIRQINVAYTSVLSILLMLLPFFLFATWFLFEDELVIKGIIANALALILFEYYQVIEGKPRFFYNFRVVYYSKLIFVTFNFIITTAGVILFGIHGLFVSLIIVYLPPIFYLVFVKRESLNFDMNFNITKDLIYLGFPILLSGMIYTLFMTVDRWFIITYYGAGQLGYYSVMISVSAVLLLVPIKFVSILTQYLREKVGKGMKKRPIFEIVFSSMLIFVLILSPLVYIVGDLVVALIRFYLTEYSATIPLVRLLLIYTLLSGALLIGNVFFVVTDNKKYLLIIQLLSVIIAIIFNAVAVYSDLGLVGIAQATMLTVIASIILSLLFIGYNKIKFPDGFYLILIFSALLTFITPNLVDKYLPLPLNGSTSDFIYVVSQHLLVILFALIINIFFIYKRKIYLPVLRIMNRT